MIVLFFFLLFCAIIIYRVKKMIETIVLNHIASIDNPLCLGCIYEMFKFVTDVHIFYIIKFNNF